MATSRWPQRRRRQASATDLEPALAPRARCWRGLLASEDVEPRRQSHPPALKRPQKVKTPRQPTSRPVSCFCVYRPRADSYVDGKIVVTLRHANSKKNTPERACSATSSNDSASEACTAPRVTRVWRSGASKVGRTLQCDGFATSGHDTSQDVEGVHDNEYKHAWTSPESWRGAPSNIQELDAKKPCEYNCADLLGSMTEHAVDSGHDRDGEKQHLVEAWHSTRSKRTDCNSCGTEGMADDESPMSRTANVLPCTSSCYSQSPATPRSHSVGCSRQSGSMESSLSTHNGAHTHGNTAPCAAVASSEKVSTVEKLVDSLQLLLQLQNQMQVSGATVTSNTRRESEPSRRRSSMERRLSRLSGCRSRQRHSSLPKRVSDAAVEDVEVPALAATLQPVLADLVRDPIVAMPPKPPSSGCWDWPLSKHERRSRVELVDQQLLRIDREVLVAKLRELQGGILHPLPRKKSSESAS